MNLRARILGAALLLATRKQLVPVTETSPFEELEPEPDFIEELLDLPEHVMQVVRTREGFYTLPSHYPLPEDILDVYEKLRATPAWFSPILRHLTEEEWTLILCGSDPVKSFRQRLRMKELKFKIAGWLP